MTILLLIIYNCIINTNNLPFLWYLQAIIDVQKMNRLTSTFFSKLEIKLSGK